MGREKEDGMQIHCLKSSCESKSLLRVRLHAGMCAHSHTSVPRLMNLYFEPPWTDTRIKSVQLLFNYSVCLSECVEVCREKKGSMRQEEGWDSFHLCVISSLTLFFCIAPLYSHSIIPPKCLFKWANEFCVSNSQSNVSGLQWYQNVLYLLKSTISYLLVCYPLFSFCHICPTDFGKTLGDAASSPSFL